MRAQMKNRRKQFVLLIGLLVVGWALGGCELFWLVVPNVPTGVDASDGNYLDQIVVIWQSVARAVRYEIWRASSADGSYVQVGETTAATYSDTEITVNATYWYKVKACNRAGCSELSDADSGYAAGEGVAQLPTGVSATDGAYTDRVRVTWNASPGAANYEIWRDVAQGGPYNLRGTVPGTLYDDMDASPGVVYWYKIKACNPSGCSAFSAADSGFTFPSAPDPVTNVSASDGTYNDRVRITWTASLGTATYEVYRSGSEGGTYALRGTATGTTYDDTGVTVGTTYWYRVRACNTAGCSAFSVPDSGFAQVGGGGGGGGGGGMPALPGQPQNVAATDGTHKDKIRVTWSSVSNTTRYEVWWSANGVEGTFAQLAETTTTSYEDTTALDMCEIRWYQVRACNASGCGPSSVPDSGYRGGTLEQVKWATTPVTVAYDGATATVTLNWTAVKDAGTFKVQYQIWRRSPGVAYALLETTAVEALTYDDNTVALGTEYYYKIRAATTYGCIVPGPFSTEVRAVVVCNPAAPTNVTATEDGANAEITWDAVTGATRYEVYRATTTPTGTYTYVGQVAASPYTDTPPAGIYYYKVKTCVSATCCGPLSAPSGPVEFP